MRTIALKVIIIYLLMPQMLISQDIGELNRKFDSIYFDTAVNVSGRDVNLAIQIADSLYIHSISDLQKIRSLMLSSTLYERRGENEEALDFAIMANEIAENAKIYEWQARISGFLSTQYRKIGLYNKGRVYLEKGLNSSKHILDENVRSTYIGMVYQETAYYDINDKDFISAEKFVILADEQFNMLPEGVNRDYFLATNMELAGRVYLNLDNYDRAYTSYYKAIELLENISQRDAPLNGFIYSGLGKIYLVKEDYENACDYLKQAEQIAEGSGFLNLKLEVYKSLTEYYKSLDDYSNYAVYNEKFIEVYKLNEINKRKTVSSFVDIIERENQELLRKRKLLISGTLLLTLGFILTAVLYNRKKKKEFERFKVVIASLKQKDNLPTIEKPVETPKSSERKNIMSPEVEQKILKDLKKFEESEKFTDKNMSISVLAGLLKTNTKYLSHILNVHKNKDFNSYINNLRIKYIIDKIEVDKEYKKYKISYLADKSGFSSHSKFTNVFKSITGFTPSLFMEYLEKDKREIGSI